MSSVQGLSQPESNAHIRLSTGHDDDSHFETSP